MMPTIPPAIETSTEMQNRQQLDRVSMQMPNLQIPAKPINPLQQNVLLSEGQWPRLVVPTTCLTITGISMESRVDLMQIQQACTVRGANINRLILLPTSTTLFEGCRFTGTIQIQAGARAVFTGCEFAGVSFCDNAGAPADVLVTGTIHRNASPHVNCTVVQELVV